MTIVERTSVLIVGAGPTGMVLALALDRLGIESILLERRATPAVHPKAHEVSSRSLEILDELGVPFERLAAEASTHEDAAKIVFGTTAREKLGCIDLREVDAHYREHTRTPAPYLNVSQTVVEATLRERLRSARRVDLRAGTSWKAAAECDGAILSTIATSDGTEHVVESRYLVACDGASSRVRLALGIEMVGPEVLDDFVNVYLEGDLRDALPTPAKLHFFFDPRCAGILVAHHPERRWVYHTPIFGLDTDVEDYTESELRERLVHALGEPARSARFVSIERWRMSGQVASQFRRGNVLLAGDAAHRFPPTGGLGMNTGIADAHNLAWKLAQVCRGEASPALLDTYETERRPVVERNCAESVRNYASTNAVLESLGLPRARADAMMRARVALLRRLPRALVVRFFALGAWVLSWWMHLRLRSPQRRASVERAIEAQWGHFDRLGLDLGASYEHGALVPEARESDAQTSSVRAYRPSTRPGSRLPHVVLDPARGTSTHDLVDRSRYTFILGGGVDSRTRAILEAGIGDVRFTVRSLSGHDGDAAHLALGIEPRGSLLVRPDGYVAFRDVAGAMEADAILRAIRAPLALALVRESRAAAVKPVRAPATEALGGAA